MLFGFKFSVSGASTLKTQVKAKLTLDTGYTSSNERWTTQDLANTKSSTEWSSTVGKATGVDSVGVKLDLFLWDDLAAANDLTVRVQQTSKLTAAGAAANIQLQQLTCLNFFTDANASAKTQWLCFLANTKITGSGTAELATNVMTHTVYHATVKPALTMYSTSQATTGISTKAFDDASNNLNYSTQKAFPVFEGAAAAAKYGEEAKFTADSIPNAKFAHMMGNYVAKDRQTVVTTFGFNGAALNTGSKVLANVSLEAGTLKAVKDGLATGFGGTGLSLADSATWASTFSATATFSTTDPNACAAQYDEAGCKKQFTLVKAGALSTIASVGAAIAALAMSF